jgi:hypothetical protein
MSRKRRQRNRCSPRHQRRDKPETIVVAIGDNLLRVPWWFALDLQARLDERHCFDIDQVEYLQTVHDHWRHELVEVEPDSFGIQYTREELAEQEYLNPGVDSQIPF